MWKVDDGGGGGCTGRCWRSRAVQLPSCRENWLQIIRASFIGRVSFLIKSADRLETKVLTVSLDRCSFCIIYIFFSFEETRASRIIRSLRVIRDARLSIEIVYSMAIHGYYSR